MKLLKDHMASILLAEEASSAKDVASKADEADKADKADHY